MKISTKGRYGLRLMVDLTSYHGKGLVPLKDIAARQDISNKYLEQIIMQLNRAGLVKSVRGSQGGYALSRPPEKITVGDVLRAVEGSLAPVDCLENGGFCERQAHCPTLTIWRRIQKAVESVVDQTTLRDMMEDAQTHGCDFSTL